VRGQFSACAESIAAWKHTSIGNFGRDLEEDVIRHVSGSVCGHCVGPGGPARRKKLAARRAKTEALEVRSGEEKNSWELEGVGKY
jgi:hypothetical protein